MSHAGDENLANCGVSIARFGILLHCCRVKVDEYTYEWCPSFQERYRAKVGE